MIQIVKLMIAVLVLFCFHCKAQQNDSFFKALEYIDLADSLASCNSFDKAANYYRRAITTQMHLDSGNWYNVFSEFRKNRFKGNNELKLIEEIGGILQQIDEGNDTLRGRMLFYLGYYKSNLGFGNASIIDYKKAIEVFQRLEYPDSSTLNFLIASYQNIAINYSRLGDQKSAIKFIQPAFNIIEEMNDKSMLCGLYLNYSKFLFYDEDYEMMKKTIQLALSECNSKSVICYALDYLAEAYIIQDSLDLAKFYLDASYAIDTNKQYQYHEIRGDYYRKIKNYSKAKHHYKIALEKLKGHISKRSYRNSLVEYSNFLYFLNEKEESVLYAHIALSSYYRGLDSLDYRDRSQIDEQLPDICIIEALHIKAKYFRENYAETHDNFSLKEATFYYNLLLTHFDKLKSKYYSSSSQYRMGAYSQKIYSEIISFFVDQYQKTKNNEDIVNAFTLAQHANSYVLKNAISDRKALEIAGVSQDSIERYLQLSSEVGLDFTNNFSNDVKIVFEFDAFKESLLSNYPLYYNFERENIISLDQIQTNLKNNSLLIKYYYFNEVLTVFGISKNEVFAENINFKSEVNHLVNSNLRMLSNNVNNDSISTIYLSASNKVYHTILGDFIDKYKIANVDHLIIIPDGPLKKVAFNALVIDSSKEWDEPSAYLLSKYSINFLYYCSQIKKENFKSAPSKGFVGFGIEYEDVFLTEIIKDYTVDYKNKEIEPMDVSLSSLKYADDEVITTAKMLNGTSYINSEVNLPKVLSLISDYNIIHFSAHSFVDQNDYLNSFIVLNNDDNNNYQLTYADILGLDVNAEMVVLSACQTSSGKNMIGEGLMSLSRAFVQSGSKSVVGSYWNAPDYATKELMILFYENLRRGMTKSKALQQAQLEFLTNDKISSPRIRTPYFWASWAVYGNNDSIALEEPFFKPMFYEFLFAGLMLFTLFFLLITKSKKKKI